MYYNQTAEIETLLYLNQSVFETTRIITHMVIPLMTTSPHEMDFISMMQTELLHKLPAVCSFVLISCNSPE